MKYVNNTVSIKVSWVITRGSTRILEDFRRASLFVFLVGKDNMFPVNYTLDDNVINAVVAPGLSEGVYGMKAIWYKDILSPFEKKYLSEGKCPPLRGRASMSQVDHLFGVTDLSSESDSYPESTLHIDISTSVATYGYDGLSAYEIAVMLGNTTLPMSEWVGNMDEVSSQIQSLDDKITKTDDKFAGVDSRLENVFTRLSVLEADMLRLGSVESNISGAFINVYNGTYQCDTKGADNDCWYDSSSLMTLPAGSRIRYISSSPGDLLIIDPISKSTMGFINATNRLFTAQEDIDVYLGGSYIYQDSSKGEYAIDEGNHSLKDILEDIYLRLFDLESEQQ